MSTSVSKSDRRFHPLRSAAWLLGISQRELCRVIRTGAIRAEFRRDGLAVSSRELRRVLGVAHEQG